MSSNIQPVQGMSDIYAPEVYLWQELESQARRVMRLHGFEEVRTPAVEYTQVFTRSLGDTTDVVQKEMYTFDDRGGRSLSLRPEGTAGVMRFAAGLGNDAQGARLFYMGPMFRCERPQAGRKRQFHQLGVECLVPPAPPADAEILALQMAILRAWGVPECQIDLNTRGLASDRQPVADGLRNALQPHLANLCEDCLRRIETNVLRVLDCKKESCRAVADQLPPVTDFMCEESRRYIAETSRLLDKLAIPYRLNPKLVRGLDYYVHTVWEISHGALGAQNALAGGGRYQMEMDGRMLEGVGFAIGMERVIGVLQQTGRTPAHDPQLVWLVSLGAAALEANLVLAAQLREQGLACRMEPVPASIKSQMRAANKAGAQFAVIRGDQELADGNVVLKDMRAGTQESIGAAALYAQLCAKGLKQV